MILSKKEREYRSNRRKVLFQGLNVWLQREKDMEAAAFVGAKARDQRKVIAGALSTDQIAQKLTFIRQEQAKLREEIRKLDKGFRRQRAWNQGKFLY